ncbi:MAG: helix-turn-helix domain-containing protein [Deltaproteobacteria bacterium]|nr:helix-turn-helix domain-containing protein [Deltaproteobacteria bacterium]
MDQNSNDNPEESAAEVETQVKELISGDFLKKTRQDKNMSLSEISKATRIGMNYLLAIEEENLSVFPARVYLKGFLRQYAKYLGLDPEKTALGYLTHKSFKRT